MLFRESLSREQALYGDLALMPHFREEYTNLTGKLLDSMNWGYEHLGRFQYMFKVDDDTFTRLDWLLDELDAVPECEIRHVARPPPPLMLPSCSCCPGSFSVRETRRFCFLLVCERT